MEAKVLAKKLRRITERTEARMRRVAMKAGQKIHENNYRRNGTQSARANVEVTTSQRRSIGRIDRVGKVECPRCLTPHLRFSFLFSPMYRGNAWA